MQEGVGRFLRYQQFISLDIKINGMLEEPL